MNEPDREKFERLMHTTFGLIAKATGIRNVRAWLAIRTGHMDVVKWPPESGKFGELVPHSMADMSLGELEAFWEDARGVIQHEVFPYIEPAAVEEIGRRFEDLRHQ